MIPFAPTIPGSRTVTARAMVCAALAAGASQLHGVPDTASSRALRAALGGLGAGIEEAGTGVLISGGRIGPPEVPLDCGSSGTTLRLLAAITLLIEGEVRLKATASSLAGRTGPLEESLAILGKRVRPGREGSELVVTGPGLLYGDSGLHGHVEHVELGPRVSQQFASGVLLVAPCMGRNVRVRVEGLRASRFLSATVDVMRRFGAVAESQVTGDSIEFEVRAGGYRAGEFHIEPDPMHSSYFLAAGAMTGRDVVVRRASDGTQAEDDRTARAVADMGCRVARRNGGIHVSASRALHGSEFPLGEFPYLGVVLAALATAASSPSLLSGLGTLKPKELRRLTLFCRELGRAGVTTRRGDDDDSIVVIPPSRGLRAVRLRCHGDHRIAMGIGLLNLLDPSIEPDDPGAVASVWPEYFQELGRLARHGTRTR